MECAESRGRGAVLMPMMHLRALTGSRQHGWAGYEGG